MADLNKLQLNLTGTPSNVEGANEVKVLLSLNPPERAKKSPVHIVAVVDVSGSMQSVAKVKNEKGVEENQGLTILDIVKHAVRTIIHSLGENDLVSLVSYHTNAKIEFEAIAMTKAGKAEAEKKLDALQPLNSTNIWDGLHSALEVVRGSQGKFPDKSASILLLTDGQPNIRPPRGEEGMFKKYKEDYPDVRCTVNTFGFGYSLDSVLLRQLAVCGNGTYSFIPDAGLVGTIFVNCISNLVTTFTSNVRIKLETQNKSTIKRIYGGFPCVLTSWGAQIDIGSATFGQSRDLVVEMDCPGGTDMAYCAVTVEYMPRGGTAAEAFTQELASVGESARLEPQRQRLSFVDTVRRALGAVISSTGRANTDNLGAAADQVKVFLKQFEDSPCKQNPEMQGLLKDAEGQVVEAFSKAEFFTKWGRHYLPSLMRAHMLQQCNNFKDPGVQFYGGKDFRQCRDEADKIFLKLPAPKPSAPPAVNYGSSRSRSSYTAAKSATRSVNMSSYYRSSNPCFDGYNSVAMARGRKLVKDVRRGDVVRTPGGGTAVVRCVVKTVVGPEAELCQVRGCLVTPFHPLRIGGEWTFPASLAPITLQRCEAVYSFVLDSEHIMLIENLECVTLGHGFTDNAVIRHPYFGTKAVVEDLKKFAGWKQGVVVFENEPMIRDEKSGLLKGFNAEKLLCA